MDRNDTDDPTCSRLSGWFRRFLRSIGKQSLDGIPSGSGRLLVALLLCASGGCQTITSTASVFPTAEGALHSTDAVVAVDSAGESIPVADDSSLASAEPAVFADRAPAIAQATAASQSIDLPTALALTAGRSPEVAWAQARIEESRAQLTRADALWLPSLRLGMNINHHDGRIQDVAGSIIETSRSSVFGGIGASAVGAGSPAVPGLQAQFRLSDAVFEPRIKRQTLSARTAAAHAASHDSLLATALAWVSLQRAVQARTLAEMALADAVELERITGEFSAAGQGLPADHDRARTEVSFRRTELHRASEAIGTASAQLARQVRWEYGTLLLPADAELCPLSLVDTSRSPQQLVAIGLSRRPEIAESKHLVSAAVQQLEREKWSPLIPSILLGVSYGGLSGGQGGNYVNGGDRFDADAAAWWEIRQLGVGEGASRREMRARVTQSRMKQIGLMDQIAREIVESHSQVEARRQRISSSQQAVEAAGESFQRNSDRIRNGQGLPLEVLQSLQALHAARREVVLAVADYNESQFALHRALGWPVSTAALAGALHEQAEPLGSGPTTPSAVGEW